MLAGLALLSGVVLLLATRIAHHADELALALGEPYGTLILTASAIVVELALIAAYLFTLCPTLTHMDAHRHHAALVRGSDQRLELGEGPVWDEARDCVWWVDSEAGDVFRGRLTGDHLDVEWHRSMGEKVGCVTPHCSAALPKFFSRARAMRNSSLSIMNLSARPVAAIIVRFCETSKNKLLREGT